MCVCVCVCSRYDLYDVDIVVHDTYTAHDGSVNFAAQGTHFVKLSLGEMVCEGQVHIRYIIMCAQNQYVFLKESETCITMSCRFLFHIHY